MKLLRLDPAYPIDDCHPVKGNPRRHDIATIRETLRLGQHRTIVVRLPNGDVLAGNGTWRAAKELGWTTIAASLVECTDAEAVKIVAGDNRAHDAGSTDDQSLADLLKSLGGDLEATGYAEDDLKRLLATLNPGPDPVPASNYKEQFGVIVLCDSEAHQAETYEGLQAAGYEKLRVVTT